MGISECRDDCGRTGFSGLNLGHTLDLDGTAIDTVSATKEGVNAVPGIDFVGCDDVLCEWLNGSAIREGSGCSEGVHRAGHPPFSFKRTV